MADAKKYKSLGSVANVLLKMQDTPGTVDEASLGQVGNLTKGVFKAHPYMSAGAAIGTGANLAGLFDNDKYGGQLGGLALGALGSGVGGLWDKNPLVGYAVTTGAGTLGALFDKLRAKKEQERAQAQAYYQ